VSLDTWDPRHLPYPESCVWPWRVPRPASVSPGEEHGGCSTSPHGVVVPGYPRQPPRHRAHVPLPGSTPGCPEARGSLLTWMFSSTFFHWQNRVNLSLQRSTERARVEPLERPPQNPSQGRRAPWTCLEMGSTPQDPRLGTQTPGQTWG